MPRILLIGSIHLDIVATFNRETLNNVDKIGRLRYAVGGTAYNVAANLIRHGYQVALLSILKENSLSSLVIAEHLKNSRINCRFLIRSPDIPESGFVAHMCDSELFSAVSCVGLEHGGISSQTLERAISWADVVALETNLPTQEIRRIAGISKLYRRPLFASCVSESKVNRILNQLTGAEFELVVMNAKEAAKVGYQTSALQSDERIRKKLCQDFTAKTVVVTRSIHGYDVYSQNGEHQHFDGINPPDLISELGAGDALYAAILAHAPHIDWLKCDETIRAFVLPVLRGEGATPDSVMTGIAPRNPLMISIFIASVLFVAAFFLAGFGHFAQNLSYATVGCLSLLVPLFGGASGGLSGGIFKDLRSGLQSHVAVARQCFLGAVAGFFVAILFVLPYLTLGGFNATRQANLQALILYEFVFSVMGGLTFEPYLDRLIKRTTLPDIASGRIGGVNN